MDEALTGFDPARDFDRLHEEAPESKLGLVCGALTTEKVARILGAGADGCIPRDLTLDAVPAVLALMAAGEKFVPAAMLPPSDAGLSDVAQDSYTVTRTAFPELTPREAAVLSMLVTGATNKEMADTLERKEITVTSHLKQIFRKLGASNRTEAAIVAFQRLYGVTPPPFAFPADAAALQKS